MTSRTPATALDAVIEAFLTARVAWIDADCPPTSTHGEHNYEGACALCRMEERRSLVAVAGLVIETLRSLPVDQRMEALGVTREELDGQE